MLAISSFTLWIGCLLVYVSSPNQKLLKSPLFSKILVSKPLFKIILYSLFSVLATISWWGMAQVYTYFIAALVVLSLIMVMWTCTVFILGHIKTSFISYFISGGIFFSILALLGGIS